MRAIVILLLAVVASSSGFVIPGPTVVRAPAHDSAIIQHHRLGGNFAYSTHEKHAYAVQQPIIQQRAVPVGVTQYAGTPVVKTKTEYVKSIVPQYSVAVSQPVVTAHASPVVQYSSLPFAAQSAAVPAAIPYAAAVPITYSYVIA